MNTNEITVSIFGFAGIVFTYWFFLGKKEKEVAVENPPGGEAGEIDIVVDGGYSPASISVQVGKTTKISFIRKDSNSCLEEVVLPDFKIKKYLPLNQKVTVEITPKKTGEFSYSCGMNMFHGKIVVH